MNILLPLIIILIVSQFCTSFIQVKKLFSRTKVGENNQATPVSPSDPIVVSLISYIVEQINFTKKGPLRKVGTIRRAYVLMRQFYEFNFDLIYTICKVGDGKKPNQCPADPKKVINCNQFLPKQVIRCFSIIAENQKV